MRYVEYHDKEMDMENLTNALLKKVAQIANNELNLYSNELEKKAWYIYDVLLEFKNEVVKEARRKYRNEYDKQ